jgi:TPR repeat protein
MTTRFPLFFVAMTLCILVACSDQRPRPDNLLVEQGQRAERLLEDAESGTAEDTYNLGMRFERGNIVRQNYPEDARWYRLSAMQAFPDAQYKLCEFSEQGRGLPQDYQEALRWCGLAADQGHGPAMFMLGRLYHTGHGVPRDVVRAHMWYNLASAYGYEEGKRWRDRLAADDDALQMTRDQVAEAQKLAREWNVKMKATGHSGH